MLSETARLAFQDGRKFTSILETVASIDDEVDVILDEKGLTIREMDPERIAMVSLFITREAMTEYNLAQSKMRFRVSITNFKRLKLTANPVTLTFNVNERNCIVEQQKPYARTFNVPLLESTGEQIPMLKEDFDGTAKFNLNTIRTIIEDARLCDDRIKIQTLLNKLCFNNGGDLLTYSTEIAEGNDLLEFTVKKETTVTVVLKYFDAVTQSAKGIAEIASLKLKTDFPLMVEIQPKELKILLSYVLAPVVG